MYRKLTFAAIATAFFLTTDHAASAQVVAYDHRSTVLGDHLAGASELVRAQGSFLRDQADAAETWVRAEAAHDDLLYQRAEYRYQGKMMEIEYQKAKTNDRRERNAQADQAEQAEAVRLYRAAQRGVATWPAALKRSEYAGSLSLIESLLRSWTPEHESGDVYRRALATETAVLRARVASNKDINFQARAEAIHTLNRVQRLTTTMGLESDQPVGGQASTQLAMR
jgi:hypothetical protein